MAGQPWDRDEFLITLDLYLNGDGYSLDTGDPQIREVAAVIDRSPSSVVLRLSNYRYLDPSADQKGQSNHGAPCREIWEEYYGNTDELARDAASAWTRIEQGISETQGGSNNNPVKTGESEGKGKTRVGQSDFRSVVRERYGDECVLCSVDEPGLLQAGHILNWSEFEEERGDPSNGILLCYTHHRAFDVGMFTLSSSYDLVVNPEFEPTGEYLRRTLVERDGDEIKFSGDPPSPEYINTHNESLYWWPPGTE